MSYIDEEEYAESKFDLTIWKKIFSHMDPFKKHLRIGISAAIVLAIIDAVYPLINVYAINNIAETGDLSKLPYFIAVYVVVMILIALMVYTFIINAGQVQQKLSYTLRQKAFKKLQELPFSYYDQTPVGWIMARMTSDSRRLSDILSWSLIDLSWGMFTMIFTSIVMFSYNLSLIHI